MAKSYEEAGVNLEAGYEGVRRIKKHVASTARTGVMGNIGAFGGMFDLSRLGVAEPVLVSGTDGVGTKLKIAIQMDRHDTIGIDAVAMCVNDVLAQGAEPIFFLDYIALGINDPVKVEAIVSGVAARRQQGAPSWAARRPRCRGCMPVTITILPGLRAAWWRRRVLSTVPRWRRAMCWWGLASSGVRTPTVSVLCARLCRTLVRVG